MNEIREIVTKAIVAKGKKTVHLNHHITTRNNPYSILGCWIINHEFEAYRKEKEVFINGEFELNIWYSTEQNTKTDVLREKIRYEKDIKTKQIVREYLPNSEDVLVKVLQHPTATEAKIVDNEIEVDITFEVLAEIIGETKMIVTIFNQNNQNDDDIEDLDIDVDEDFLNK